MQETPALLTQSQQQQGIQALCVFGPVAESKTEAQKAGDEVKQSAAFLKNLCALQAIPAH